MLCDSYESITMEYMWNPEYLLDLMIMMKWKISASLTTKFDCKDAFVVEKSVDNETIAKICST